MNAGGRRSFRCRHRHGYERCSHSRAVHSPAVGHGALLARTPETRLAQGHEAKERSEDRNVLCLIRFAPLACLAYRNRRGFIPLLTSSRRPCPVIANAPNSPGAIRVCVQFFAFTSLVIGLHGEFQFLTDPVLGPNEGISILAVSLHEQGYDSHMDVENEVEADGSGAVYDEIVSAVQNRGGRSIGLYGFSHGGGSVYDLSERLDANKASIEAFDIVLPAISTASRTIRIRT